MSNYDAFNNDFDFEALAKEAEEIRKNKGHGDYKDVPVGTYEVKIEKMEIKDSKAGNKMLSVMFRVLEGEFKNSCIFMNQSIMQGFQLAIALDFLDSLGTKTKASKAKTMGELEQMVMDIMEEIDGHCEFLLNFGKTPKGFNTFRIDDIYDI